MNFLTYDFGFKYLENIDFFRIFIFLTFNHFFFKKCRWESLADEPYKRKLNFLPKKHDCLRKVPMYERFINERFERCLDLYLAPRARKMRLTIQPEDLVPQLPKPHDLQVNFVKNPLFQEISIFPPKTGHFPIWTNKCMSYSPICFFQKRQWKT